jgi:hypothetical protein
MSAQAPSPRPDSRPDLDHDVIVERHILAIVGVQPPPAGAPPAWSVWVGRALMLRTDSRDDAVDEGARLSTTLHSPLWLCEDGEHYTLTSGSPVRRAPR